MILTTEKSMWDFFTNNKQVKNRVIVVRLAAGAEAVGPHLPWQRGSNQLQRPWLRLVGLPSSERVKYVHEVCKFKNYYCVYLAIHMLIYQTCLLDMLLLLLLLP